VWDFIKKTLKFIWYDDSVLSWIINVLIAFILVKFLIYPFFGMVLATSHPLVAVVSGSMEHDVNFNMWWDQNKVWYEGHGITREQFVEFTMVNGFNKGDIIVLRGKDSYEVGDIIVYTNTRYKNPIIHRIIEKNGKDFYRTKGDNNLVEDPIIVTEVIGKAVIRIPLLGWVKIIFTGFIENIMGVVFK